jgi:hyperosmotically inducible protein
LSFLLVAVVGLTSGAAWAASESIGDELLGLQVKAKLLSRLEVAAIPIAVSARAGGVTLSGDVTRRSDAELAVSLAKTVKGVRSVVDSTAFRAAADANAPAAPADPQKALADAVLQTQVKTRLVQELGRYGTTIEVVADGGTVSLKGNVPAPQRQAAVQVAEQLSGVEKVLDLLHAN